MSKKTENNNLELTSFEDILKASQGEIVSLPPFVKDIPFVVQLKRPSMMSLVSTGKIPNSLLTMANGLFVEGSSSTTLDIGNEKMMKDLFTILEAVSKESFVNPSYDELIKAGIRLTDEQLMAVFSYAQNGVKSLENFRK